MRRAFIAWRETCCSTTVESLYRSIFDGAPTALVRLDMSELNAIMKEALAGVADPIRHLETNPELCDRVLRASCAREVNVAAVRLFDASSPEELLGPIDWVWKSSPGTIRRSLAARLRGDVSYAEETRVMTRTGRTLDVLYSMAFSPMHSDRDVSLVSFTDLGDRVRAEALAEQRRAELAHGVYQSMLAELTAAIAHEVNQPLAAILSAAGASLRWLDRAPPNVEEVRTSLSRIMGDTRRASETIGRLRAMTTPTLPELREVSIDAVVEEAAHYLRHESARRRTAVVLDLQARSAHAKLDRLQIQQVLVNLSVNAMQAMARRDGGGGTLVIRTRTSPEHVTVSVEDEGPGISAESIARVLLGYVPTTDHGAPMGLLLCRSVIEAHNGTIEATNRPEGGAVVSFRLPSQL